MDILIRGMEMPKDDILRIEICPDGQVNRIIGWALSEPKKAKAVALSSHGDLIERDRAIDEMEYVSFDTAYNCELAQEVLRYNVPVFLEATNE